MSDSFDDLGAIDKLYRVRRLAGLVLMAGTAEILDQGALSELGVTLEDRFDDALASLEAERACKAAGA